MKLYYSPLACSLADHIALIEAGVAFDSERVDLKTKMTASGRDFRMINAKGYVPALVLDSGETITENVALLDWIAQQHPALGVSGLLGRTRLLETLAFIATELHPNFKPMWHDGSEKGRAEARLKLAERLGFLAGTVKGDFLFGSALSVADCYLFVMLRWAEKFDVTVPENLIRLQTRMERRESVRAAMKAEGWESANNRRPPSVRENAGHSRFERPISGDAIAAAYYKVGDGILEFVHTEVPAEFSGRGIATELARGTFDLLRKSGRRASLTCPFMIHFFGTHPEYADVVEA